MYLRDKKRVNLWAYQQVWNKTRIFEKTLNSSSFASLTHKHPFGTSKIQLQKDFSQSKEGLWQLRARWRKKEITSKGVPFNIWKVMGEQNYWRAPHFITSLKTIFAKIPQNLCCISNLESIFSTQCANWLCAFFSISKLIDSIENSLD